MNHKKEIKKRLTIILGILNLTAFLLAAYFIIFISTVNAEVKYAASPVIGDEIIIYFDEPVIRSTVEENFSIVPYEQGDFEWLNKDKELRFMPKNGFKPGTFYRLNVNNSYSKKLVKIKPLEFNFEIPKPPALRKTKIAREALYELPLSGDKVRSKYSNKNGNIAYPSEGKYIDVNLKTMIIKTVIDGRIKKTYDVAAAGSPWRSPTPQGNFKVLHKEKNHFSSISLVWMPWSIHFYDDYFLHEVPYFPSGRRLSSKYSGGCVRIPIGAAEEIYNFAEIGTPIIVHAT